MSHVFSIQHVGWSGYPRLYVNSVIQAPRLFMSEYYFLTSGNSVPIAPRGTARSHAIRNALQLREAGPQGTKEASNSQKSSQTIVRLQRSLAGKFRVKQSPRQKKVNEALGQSALAGGKASESALRLSSATERPDEAAYSDRQLVVRAPTIVPGQITQEVRITAADSPRSLPIFDVGSGGDVLRFFLCQLMVAHQQQAWFKMAIAKPVLMNITLALSATIWSSTYPDTQPSIKNEGMLRKATAIKDVNTLLQAPSITCEVIALVAKLSFIAGSEGFYTEAAMHLNAVRKLIGIKGGIETLSPSTVDAVNGANLQLAAILGHLPLLPLTTPLDQLLNDERPAESSMMLFKSVVQSLRRVIRFRINGHRASDTVKVLLNYADVQILKALQIHHNTMETRLARSLHAAAHVFSHVHLRRWSKNGYVAHMLILRLRRTFDDISLDGGHCRNTLTALLWAMLIGAIAGGQHSELERDWFESQSLRVAHMLGLYSLMDVKSCLQNLVWVEDFAGEFLGSWLVLLTKVEV